MNKKLYNLIGAIPVFGKVFQMRINVLYWGNSPFRDDSTKTSEYYMLRDWAALNPDKIITKEIAKNILQKNK